MSRKLGLAVCACALFGGGWLTGTEQSGYQHNAETWQNLKTFEKVLFVEGFHQGYSSAADAKELLADNKIAGPQRALLKKADRDMTGSGRNQHMKMGQIATSISAFYSDYRNQAVCWAPALTFSVMALNGDSPTEQELDAARGSSAKSGCE
jgi:hypothetical protein